MNAVLLDTDVFSYLMKPGDTRAKVYDKHVKGKTVAVSFITYGELLFGATKKKWGANKLRKLEERLKAVVVVPYDNEICRTYAKIRASLPPGITVAPNDLWIAACAMRHGIPLVSNNKKHFEKIPGLNLITENPPAAAAVSSANLKLKFDGGDETESSPGKKAAAPEPSA